MAQFQSLVEDFLEANWRHNPTGATRVGIHRYDDKLPDRRPEAMEQWGKALADFKRGFESLDEARLSDSEKLDRTWAIALLERALLEHELRNWERDPRSYLQDLGSGLHDLLIGEFIPLEERMHSVLARLQAVSGYLETARRTLKPEAIPPVWVEYGLMTARSTRQFIIEALPQAAAEAPALAAEVVAAAQSAAQAIEEFSSHLQSIGGRAQGDFAIGPDRFNRLLRDYHLLDMDCEDLYAFGREWIERYEQEMTAVARQMDPAKDWIEVLEQVKDNHPDAAALRQAYEDETLLARQICLEHDLITFPAGESCTLEWMPAFLRASSPIALPWVAPAFAPGLASKWYITPVDEEAPPGRQTQHLRDNSWAWIRGIAMHEIYPGHHLNFVIAKGIATPLRLLFTSPVYVEGWGLYTEELFYEIGFLKDPPLRLMQLRNGLWRAVRIVVDTGLHTRGMSLEESARWLSERARLEPRWAESETRLYTTRPTYPSSYRVGLSMVMELRDRYKAMQGDACSLKQFHDEFMSYSFLPLKLVSEAMLSPAAANQKA